MSDDLADLRAMNLPFNVDEVIPQCHECIRKQLEKYKSAIDADKKAVGKRFLVPCKGIKKEILDPSIRNILTDEQVRQAEAAADIAKFAEMFLKSPDGEPWVARWYQKEVLACTATRKVLRVSRRSGKCLAEGSKVLTVDGQIEVEKLLTLPNKPEIITFDQNTGSLVKTKDYFVWENGTKETIQIVTQFGKSNK